MNLGSSDSLPIAGTCKLHETSLLLLSSFVIIYANTPIILKLILAYEHSFYDANTTTTTTTTNNNNNNIVN